MKNIKDFNVKNKRVLVRCDFNVPLDDKGNILDDFKIKKTLPTIKYLILNRAKIILMSHLGRPEGKIVPTLKLDKIRDRIEKLLDISIMKSFDCVGKDVENQASRLKKGEILLLENLRFHKEEFDNDEKFAKELSKLGDIYINDAFAVCHRPHASIIGVPKYLPHGSGFLLQEEMENLGRVLKNPKRPMLVLIGGTKVDTKDKFIEKISEFADLVIISGLIKKDIIEKNMQFKYPEKIISPQGNLNALDMDGKTTKLFLEKIMAAKTILWNGPFGKFEDENYKKGTLAIAKAIIKSKAFSAVGGGQTVEFLNKEGIISKFSYVSTGGGAMLSYVSGEELPGLKVLE